ncbi:MAG: hypothetical protein A3F16_00045 [Deltaproteobacteria bacterium RIFCSPHIGHO2_12_FULL_43_9]|nr:MAG: hypothetical protein A3F16_00045 [Deltaproteobacteria bacterium RIFCSPHIGHO2_12_FULL_43_9]
MRYFITIFLAILSFNAVARAELVTIEVKGEAHVEEEALSQATLNAVNDAKKKAVELQILSLLPEDVIEKSSKIIQEKIYDQMERFVVRYSTVKSGEVYENILTVTLEAVVDVGSIRRELVKSAILKNPAESTTGKEAIEVRFTGIKEITRLARYEEWLQTSVPGIKSLLPRSMKSGEAIYSAMIDGSLREAVSLLGSRMPDGARVTLNVDDQQSKTRLEIQVLEK